MGKSVLESYISQPLMSALIIPTHHQDFHDEGRRTMLQSLANLTISPRKHSHRPLVGLILCVCINIPSSILICQTYAMSTKLLRCHRIRIIAGSRSLLRQVLIGYSFPFHIPSLRWACLNDVAQNRSSDLVFQSDT
jgi:hypothetical protein